MIRSSSARRTGLPSRSRLRSPPRRCSRRATSRRSGAAAARRRALRPSAALAAASAASAACRVDARPKAASPGATRRATPRSTPRSPSARGAEQAGLPLLGRRSGARRATRSRRRSSIARISSSARAPSSRSTSTATARARRRSARAFTSAAIRRWCCSTPQGTGGDAAARRGRPGPLHRGADARHERGAAGQARCSPTRSPGRRRSAPNDWRLLAFYSWDTDQQQLIAEGRAAGDRCSRSPTPARRRRPKRRCGCA